MQEVEIHPLKDSRWLTHCWNWIMNFAGRAAEPVLFITMVLTCYQIIPGAPALSDAARTTIFVIQFIALDVGGMGLHKIADMQGLGRDSKLRKTGDALIRLTLATIVFAGISFAVDHLFVQTTVQTTSVHTSTVQHTGPSVWDYIKTIVEILFVIARSFLTVIYCFVIEQTKHQAKNMQQELDTLRVQLSTVQSKLSSASVQLSSKQKEVDTLTVQLDTANRSLSTVQSELSSEREHLASLKMDTQSGHQELSTVQREMYEAKSEADRLTILVSTKDRTISDLQRELDRKQKELDSARVQLDSKHSGHWANTVDSGHSKMDSGQWTVDSGQAKSVDSGQKKVVQFRSVHTQKNGQVDSGQVDKVREILEREPGISGRKIAERLNISPTTASKLIKEARSDSSENAVNS